MRNIIYSLQSAFWVDTCNLSMVCKHYFLRPTLSTDTSPGQGSLRSKLVSNVKEHLKHHVTTTWQNWILTHFCVTLELDT